MNHVHKDAREKQCASLQTDTEAWTPINIGLHGRILKTGIIFGEFPDIFCRFFVPRRSCISGNEASRFL